jgi:hypothetical protein
MSRQLVFDEDEINYSFGKFLMRSGKYSDDYDRFWTTNAITSPTLSRFALALGSLSVTEAAVERSFKQEARILNKHRANLTEETTEALLFISINNRKISAPEYQQKTVTHAEKRAGKGQCTLDLLLEKKRARTDDEPNCL